jgi:hypothetical protein
MAKPSTKTGMQCVSVRSKSQTDQRCPNKATEWCGKHKNSQIRYICETIEHVPEVRRTDRRISDIPVDLAVIRIKKAWVRWIAKRAGPLLYHKELSNNPFDFFSSDPVEEISLHDFISFVDAGKGYIMDIKSIGSLLDHAKKCGEAPLNPFNRSPLTATFLARVKRHRSRKEKVQVWAGLQADTEAQRFAMATTDIFRALDDMGNYTNPEWFLSMTALELQRLYIELADIWYHRATLTAADRTRIVPTKVFKYPVTTVLIMKIKALRPLLLETCRLLITSAVDKGDRQLGGMYVLGGFALVSAEASTSFPWLLEMFTPGVTRIQNGVLSVAHPSVLAY